MTITFDAACNLIEKSFNKSINVYLASIALR